MPLCGEFLVAERVVGKRQRLKAIFQAEEAKEDEAELEANIVTIVEHLVKDKRKVKSCLRHVQTDFRWW